MNVAISMMNSKIIFGPTLIVLDTGVQVIILNHILKTLWFIDLLVDLHHVRTKKMLKLKLS